MAKNILVMPGTYWVAALCKRIKELGHRVLLVDPNEDCPCREYADEYLKSDIFDWDKVYKFAYEKNIDAAISDECDIAMPVVSRLGEALHLHVQSQKIIGYYTDKYLMREFCIKHGLNCPEYKLCRTEKDVSDFYHTIGCSIIIKPIDSNASHGVFRINSDEDIKKYFYDALFFSRKEKVVLAERYIEGREFTIDGIKTREKHYTLAISKKKHYKHNPSIANELFFSYDDSEYDYEKLREVNDKYVMASQLEYGFTHAEYKYEDGKFFLIEIAARGGGNMISSVITQYLSGYQTYDYLIDTALGKVEDQDFTIPEEYKSRCAVLKFFDSPGHGGIVKRIKGESYLKECSAIKAYQLHFGVGDEIKDCVSDSARIGFYIACSETREEMHDIMQNIDDHFSIEI